MWGVCIKKARYHITFSLDRNSHQFFGSAIPISYGASRRLESLIDPYSTLFHFTRFLLSEAQLLFREINKGYQLEHSAIHNITA